MEDEANVFCVLKEELFALIVQDALEGEELGRQFFAALDFGGFQSLFGRGCIELYPTITVTKKLLAI